LQQKIIVFGRLNASRACMLQSERPRLYNNAFGGGAWRLMTTLIQLL